MSEIESPYVYRGAWLDHEKGAIIGKTITTDTRTGTIIIAILAILSSLATTHLWHLVTFCYHQYRAGASRLRSDAAFKQQQVLLRTLASPGALVADLTKIYWAWRKTDSKQPLLNWLPFTTLAALFAVASVAVGILSSYIVDTSNLQILVQSPFCGPLIIEPDSAAQDVAGIYRPTVQELALPLVQECYKNNVSDSARCRVFTKPRIPFKVTRDVCPWTSSMCDLQSNISTVTMDSGHLDMNEAFGLNLPPNNGVMFRKKTSCAVLSLRNRTTIVPMSAFPGYPRPPLPQEELLIVSFGHFAGNRTWRNSTFAISLATTNVTTDFTSL
jgi:hypothetical protein